eukprot:SAG31_NODE_1550_length_7909_cov_4.107554_3_plen_36_part_00
MQPFPDQSRALPAFVLVSAERARPRARDEETRGIG